MTNKKVEYPFLYLLDVYIRSNQVVRCSKHVLHSIQVFKNNEKTLKITQKIAYYFAYIIGISHIIFPIRLGNRIQW